MDVVLFSCVLGGTGTHVMGKETFDIGPGSVGLTHYGQRHDLLTTATGIEIINLYLDLEAHPLPMLPAPLRPTLSAILAPHPGLVHRLNRRLHVVFDDVERMARPLRAMLREIEDRAAGYEAMTRQALVAFLVELCRVVGERDWLPIAAADAGQPAWLESVRLLLDARYADPLTLDGMAEHAGVSPEHLCRRFKRYAGVTPIAYLTARRVQAAMWALRTSDEPVLRIALASGFNDLSHFNRTFKASVGQTPTGYRKRGDRR